MRSGDRKTGQLLTRVPVPRNQQIYEDNRAQVSAMGCSLTPLEYDNGLYNLAIGDDGRAYVTRRDQINTI